MNQLSFSIFLKRISKFFNSLWLSNKFSLLIFSIKISVSEIFIVSKTFFVEIGIIGLSNIEIFHVLINKLTSLPLRWREKIKRHYSREVYFDQLLKKLSDNKDINPKIVEQDKVKAELLRKKDPLIL